MIFLDHRWSNVRIRMNSNFFQQQQQCLMLGRAWITNLTNRDSFTNNNVNYD